MKIFFFIPDLSGGGAERMILNLAGGLVSKGHDVSVVIATSTKNIAYAVPLNVKIIELGCSRTILSVFKLQKLLRESKPQVLLSTIFYACLVAVVSVRLSFVKIVNILRVENSLRSYLAGMGFWSISCFSFLIRFFFTKSTYVVGVSQGLANEMVEYWRIPSKKVVKIYNPVVSDEITGTIIDDHAHPWFGKGFKIILGIGRFNPQKDFSTLIHAFSLLENKNGLRLIILGDGEERQALQALVESLGLKDLVDLPGFVSNPFVYMKQADVFVLSSRYEGLPGALIQAMACGCQVVSTDCPYGPDEILMKGKFGFLVPVNDAQMLMQGITQALSHPKDRQQIIQRAGDFSVSASLEQYEKLFFKEGFV